MIHNLTLSWIIIICIILTAQITQGQNFYLYNVKTSQIREVFGSVKVITRSLNQKESSYRGHAAMLNDSILAIDDILVHINDIYSVRAVTNKSRLNGIILAVVSSGFITLGTVFAIQSGNATGLGVVGKVILSILSYTAGVSTLYQTFENLIFGKKYLSQSGWVLKKTAESIVMPDTSNQTP